MTNEILVAGFGGQGVMAIGKTLTEAGMKEGKEVSWLPSYGPEMRGGTANCSVVLSDDPIVSPIVLEPSELIAMNLPSLIKFEPTVKSDLLSKLNNFIYSAIFSVAKGNILKKDSLVCSGTLFCLIHISVALSIFSLNSIDITIPSLKSFAIIAQKK